MFNAAFDYVYAMLIKTKVNQTLFSLITGYKKQTELTLSHCNWRLLTRVPSPRRVPAPAPLPAPNWA